MVESCSICYIQAHHFIETVKQHAGSCNINPNTILLMHWFVGNFEYPHIQNNYYKKCLLNLNNLATSGFKFHFLYLYWESSGTFHVAHFRIIQFCCYYLTIHLGWCYEILNLRAGYLRCLENRYFTRFYFLRDSSDATGDKIWTTWVSWICYFLEP